MYGTRVNGTIKYIIIVIIRRQMLSDDVCFQCIILQHIIDLPDFFELIIVLGD